MRLLSYFAIMQIDKKYASIELLSRHQCLLSNLPFKLSPEIINSHQMSYSPTLQTYMFDINLINSLRRILKESQIIIEDLPAEVIELFATVGKTKCLKYQQMPDEVGSWILRPHQQSAIDFFTKRGGRIIIGDAWAMGKTVTALAIMKTFAFQTVLIVCSSVLVAHWQYHLSEAFQQTSIQILTDSSLCMTKQNTARYLIATPQIWKLMTAEIKKINLVVIDEPQLSNNSFQYLNHNCSQTINLRCNFEYLLVVDLLQQFVAIVRLFRQQLLFALSSIPYLFLPFLCEYLLQLTNTLSNVSHSLLMLFIFRCLLNIACHFNQQLVQRWFTQIFSRVDSFSEQDWAIVELRKQFEDVGLF